MAPVSAANCAIQSRQALAISDRGAILDGGRVPMEGAAATLLADDRAAALYLGQGHAAPAATGPA